MSKVIDLTGKQFGRLTVVGRGENTSQGQCRWICKCKCGKERLVRGADLRRGNTVSCGCETRDRIIKQSTKHGNAARKSKTRLYNVWCGMKERCNNPRATNYNLYGERGISICEEWKDFNAFKDWAEENGYDPKAKRGICTLDRIDVNGNYEPANCRWVDMKVQVNNRRTSNGN